MKLSTSTSTSTSRYIGGAQDIGFDLVQADCDCCQKRNVLGIAADHCRLKAHICFNCINS